MTVDPSATSPLCLKPHLAGMDPSFRPAWHPAEIDAAAKEFCKVFYQKVKKVKVATPSITPPGPSCLTPKGMCASLFAMAWALSPFGGRPQTTAGHKVLIGRVRPTAKVKDWRPGSSSRLAPKSLAP